MIKIDCAPNHPEKMKAAKTNWKDFSPKIKRPWNKDKKDHLWRNKVKSSTWLLTVQKTKVLLSQLYCRRVLESSREEERHQMNTNRKRQKQRKTRMGRMRKSKEKKHLSFSDPRKAKDDSFTLNSHLLDFLVLNLSHQRSWTVSEPMTSLEPSHGSDTCPKTSSEKEEFQPHIFPTCKQTTQNGTLIPIIIPFNPTTKSSAKLSTKTTIQMKLHSCPDTN